MSGINIKISTDAGDQSVSVRKSHITIGKASHCDVRPPGDAADEHLRVWSDGSHLWGQDLGSKFGTSVNGVMLQPMRPILFRDSDVFQLSKSGPSLRFQSLNSNEPTWPSAVTLNPEEPAPENDAALKTLKQENQRLRSQVDELRAQMRNAVAVSPEEEEEVSQVKQNALTEVKSMREAESRRFEVWKRESVADLEKTVASLIRVRPGARVSKEEATADVAMALRTVLLGGRAPGRRRRRTSHSGVKYVFLLLFAGLLCMVYVARGRWTTRRPASLVYVAPHPAQVTYVKSKNGKRSPTEAGQE